MSFSTGSIFPMRLMNNHRDPLSGFNLFTSVIISLPGFGMIMLGKYLLHKKGIHLRGTEHDKNISFEWNATDSELIQGRVHIYP